MTPHSPIDSAINNAASRMTSAKPSEAWRAKVMSRIAVERPAGFPWRFVFAGGAIASVALVAFVSWPTNPTIPTPTIPTPTLINPTVINSKLDPTAAADATSPLLSVSRTAAANDSGQLVLATLTDADQEWLSRSVPALEHPELMTVRPLLGRAQVAIDIEPIRVAPLVVLAIGDDNQ